MRALARSKNSTRVTKVKAQMQGQSITRKTRLKAMAQRRTLGMATSLVQTVQNQDRFEGGEDQRAEAIYAEVILDQVNDFLSMLYDAVHFFYLPVVAEELLCDTSEDLIEIVTSLVINKDLSPWLIKLCRLSTREEEAILTTQLAEFGSLAPEQVSIGQYFTLNQSSKLFSVLREV